MPFAQYGAKMRAVRFAVVCAIAVAIVAFAGWMASAAPTPERPPERRPMVSIADLTCERPPALMMLAMRRDGRIVVSLVDDAGCLRWRPWTPMVRAR